MSDNATQDLARSIARECIARRARQIGRVLTGIYDKELRPAGVTVAQFNLLVALGCGLRTAKELGERLQLEKSTVSRNLEHMTRLGWLEARAAQDGRSAELTLTPAGRRQLRSAHPAWQRAQDAARALCGSHLLGHLEELEQALR